MPPSTNIPRSPSLNTPVTGVLPGGRIPILDGIRGIAVLLVMVFHFWVFGTVTGNMFWERVYAGAAGMGWVGVDLFFVLSGFLITGILYDSRGSEHYYRVFYARRTVRIFPLYYLSLALFFWIIPFLLVRLHHMEFTEISNNSRAKFFAWTYLLNWYEGLKGFNVVSLPLQHFWSLAVEEQFYLVWPFLVLTLGRRRLMSLCGGLMGFGLLLRLVFYGIHLPSAAYTLTFSRADSLAVGAIVALAARDPQDWKALVKWAKILAVPALCGVVIMRVLNPLCTTGPGSSPNLYMGTFGISLVGIFFGACLTMAICLQHGSVVHRFLGSSFLRFFGKYSYCLYICHLPLIVLFAKVGLNSNHLSKVLGDKFLAIVAVNGIAFAASIVISLLSWTLFETHWLKLKDLPFLQRADRHSEGVLEDGGNLAPLPRTITFPSSRALGSDTSL